MGDNFDDFKQSTTKKFVFKKKVIPTSSRSVNEPDSSEVLKEPIEIIDLTKKKDTKESVGGIFSDSDSSSPSKEKENNSNRFPQSANNEAWKGLMSRMQHNQKETFKNIKNKPQKRASKGVLQSSKSPIKRAKMNDAHNIGSVTEKPTNCAVSSTIKAKENSSCTSMTIAIEQHKLAAIFLKPEEKLNATKIKSLENLKSCNTESFLRCMSDPKPNNTNFVHNPKYFDNNVVLLNKVTAATSNAVGRNQAKIKTCPFYKILPGTNFSVDAFNYGVIPGIEVYFLSHFHSDHYVGLTKKFSKTIICSPPTGNLVKMKIGVDDDCIRKLQLNTPYIIEGTEVVLVDANHCPGSVMFIFRLPNGLCYFHTGDFRYTQDMLENSFIRGARRADILYLDTTYCDPKYDFPKQVDSIAQLAVSLIKHVEVRPRTLIVCGSYLIGKERVYFSLAEALGTKVFGLLDKRRIIKELENPIFEEYLTDNESQAKVHVMNMQSITPQFMSEYLASRLSLYSNIVGIKPSGWQFSSSKSGNSVKSFFNNTVTLIGVPYSEHSSFSELRELVTEIRPVKVQATVNVANAKKRIEMMEHIESWNQ